MNLGFHFVQSHVLTHKKRHLLKHILKLQLELKEPEFLNPAKGMEGMLKAHELLKERNSSGILVGGLSHEIWGREKKEEDLAKHKDVDVLALSKDFYLKEKFEKGIDWWMPKTDRIVIKGQYGNIEKEQTYYENGFGVFLRYGVKCTSDLPSGLYIGSQNLIRDMRFNEAMSLVDPNVQLDMDEDELHNKVSKVYKMGANIPKFLLVSFKEYILSREHTSDWRKYDALKIEAFDFEKVTAIQRYKEEN